MMKTEFPYSNRKKHEKEIAKWLHSLREEKGISQEYLGIQLGKGQSDIAKIESASKKVSLFEVLAWMAALGVPFEKMQDILRPIYKVIINKNDTWNGQ